MMNLISFVFFISLSLKAEINLSEENRKMVRKKNHHPKSPQFLTRDFFSGLKSTVFASSRFGEISGEISKINLICMHINGGAILMSILSLVSQSIENISGKSKTVMMLQEPSCKQNVE